MTNAIAIRAASWSEVYKCTSTPLEEEGTDLYPQHSRSAVCHRGGLGSSKWRGCPEPWRCRYGQGLQGHAARNASDARSKNSKCMSSGCSSMY